MIDRTKFQVEVLKDMLSFRPRMRQIPISDDEIGITDGYHVVVFPKASLKIKWEDLPVLEYDISEASTDLPQIFDSKIRKNVDQRTIVKLWSKDKETLSFVNQKYLKVFSGCDLFSNGGIKAIYAFDGIGNLAGIILPVREREVF